MTNQQHPITPPPELVQQWWADFNGAFYEFEAITANVFQAGADTELEACCHCFARDLRESLALELRARRRPKPMSLKEQALLAIDTAVADDRLSADVANVVRRALESIND